MKIVRYFVWFNGRSSGRCEQVQNVNKNKQKTDRWGKQGGGGLKSGSDYEFQLLENVDHIPFDHAQPVEQRRVLLFRRFMVVDIGQVASAAAANQLVNCCRTVTSVCAADRYRGLIMAGQHRERPDGWSTR